MGREGGVLGKRIDDSGVQRIEGAALRKCTSLDPGAAKGFEVHRFSYCIRKRITSAVY